MQERKGRATRTTETGHAPRRRIARSRACRTQRPLRAASYPQTRGHRFIVMDWNALTSIAAIAAPTLVGSLAVLIPALTRRGDRKHERQLRVRDRRAEAYTKVLDLMHDLPNIAATGRDDNYTREPGILIWLWGSKDVRDLFAEWAKIQHLRYGPTATAEDKERVMSAENAVRQRMSDEVQGKAEIE